MGLKFQLKLGEDSAYLCLYRYLFRPLSYVPTPWWVIRGARRVPTSRFGRQVFRVGVVTASKICEPPQGGGNVALSAGIQRRDDDTIAVPEFIGRADCLAVPDDDLGSVLTDPDEPDEAFHRRRFGNLELLFAEARHVDERADELDRDLHSISSFVYFSVSPASSTRSRDSAVFFVGIPLLSQPRMS